MIWLMGLISRWERPVVLNDGSLDRGWKSLEEVNGWFEQGIGIWRSKRGLTFGGG